MGEVKTHKDLDVWNKSILFVVDVYNITTCFPDAERYGLTNQIRRAAVSIPSNIAEGAARVSGKEFVQFLSIAIASSAEVETQLIISKELNFLANDDFDKLNDELNDIQKMLLGLRNKIKKTINN